MLFPFSPCKVILIVKAEFLVDNREMEFVSYSSSYSMAFDGGVEAINI